MKLTEMRPDQLRKAVQIEMPVLIAAGVIEYHGPHLPIGTDLLMTERLCEAIDRRHPCVIAPSIKCDIEDISAIGISCGGPLDSSTGFILSPPNLPAWAEVDVVTPFLNRYCVPVGLQNDANACALAEWRWGAGKGCQHLVFLTFGTGMGAGFILGGRLYSGASDMAGGIGHIRMEESGPVGYGKAGSFEGFCSGGGIAQLARKIAREKLQAGIFPAFCPNEGLLNDITAQNVGDAAMAGDRTALQVLQLSGRQLGRGLALLVDLLNPEKIVIGSIFGRLRAFLEPAALQALAQEALTRSSGVCQIVPAGLGESIGDYAALSVADYELVKTLSKKGV